MIGINTWNKASNKTANVGSSTTIIEQVLPEIVVYKSATCTCCHKWVTHLENEGFTVQAHNREDMNNVKSSLGVIPGLASCHTAVIDGYLIEGHVPASDIKRLLTERPKNIVGLTAPGMPRFSPGMQAEGQPPRGYDVLTFDEDGNTHVFSQY
ncbi:MAG: DUF411 domain-containing protein [Piscirickettsiaceae bacterium]|nr:DUF411 domain-containing protein [Piscirickettsiaceae bacterium]